MRGKTSWVIRNVDIPCKRLENEMILRDGVWWVCRIFYIQLWCTFVNILQKYPKMSLNHEKMEYEMHQTVSFRNLLLWYKHILSTICIHEGNKALPKDQSIWTMQYIKGKIRIKISYLSIDNILKRITRFTTVDNHWNKLEIQSDVIFRPCFSKIFVLWNILKE